MNNPKDCVHCYDYEDMGCKMTVCELDFPSINTPKCSNCPKFIKRDFVQVVRCKDCIHFWKGICNAHNDVIYVDDNDYCSHAEREEDGEIS